jgi:HK97 family phage prohead protease
MLAPDVDLVRAAANAIEFRDDATDGDGDDLGLLNGHFSVFNNWYQIDSFWEGSFLERIAPGAFADTIANDRAGMKVLFDHGFDPVIGNKALGPIEDLREDKTGPYYEVPLMDTSYNRDLLPGLKRGLYGASFRFRVQEETWVDEPKASKANPKGVPERTINRVQVMEFGPVTFPANPKASAGVRSLTDTYYERLRQKDTQAYDAAVRAAGRTLPKEQTIRSLLDGVLTPEEVELVLSSLNLTGRPDARSTGGGDAGQAGSNNGDPSLNGAPITSKANEQRHLLLRVKGIVK